MKLNYHNSEYYFNLANESRNKGNLKEAVSFYQKFLNFNPNNEYAFYCLTMTQLLMGDYENGLKNYDRRFYLKENTCLPISKPNCFLWNGKSLKKNDKLILVSEQGLGDILQFMRYAIHFKNQGINVSLCADTSLHELIKISDIDFFPLSPQKAEKINTGLWVPLLSVPRHLKVTPKNPIITNPYIKTTKKFIDKWKNILSTEKRPIIAINWQGNQHTEKFDYYKGRSLSLSTFSQIFNNKNISILSLQKGFGSEQIEFFSHNESFVNCQNQINEIWDLLETSAIIMNCDLVITSDTSIAHLSGGLGKETWLLLKKIPDWRWGFEGEETFWYPSMKLFRQKEDGNWDEVLNRVKEEIQKKYNFL